MRTTVAMVIIAASLLAASGGALAAAVYWVPAHELAPQGGIYGSLAACDLDGDGDQDVSFLNFSEEQIPQFWNVGTPAAPVWQMDMDVLPARTNCWSRMGTYGDIDADGDFDLIDGCMQPGLHLYRNIGTPQAPAWMNDPAPVLGLSSSYFAEPCLADVDADGDLDLVTAYSGVAGALLHRNIGTPLVPQWEQTGSWLPGLDAWGGMVLGDLDLDGDLDAVGSPPGGGVACYENTGTPQAPAFALNAAMLTGIPPPGDYLTSIALLDIDADGDTDLLFEVRLDSNVYLYLNESVTTTHRSTWGTIKALYR